jgi:uncharacterized repeat protein (TIGR01451 family)
MKQKNESNRSRTGFVSILILICILISLVPSAQADTASSTLSQNELGDTPPPPGDEGSRIPTIAPLVVTQSAQTDASTPGVVYNGGTVTYTLSLHNEGTETITDILVKDFLPREGETVYYLQDVTCTRADYGCTLIDNSYPILLPSGNTVAVTATREISWVIPSLAPDILVELEFSGVVLGQPDGTTFTNRAEATYSGQVVRSDPLALTVEVLLEVSGEAAVSSVPTWFSHDVGGTISQDWGDFDRDGFLDLVLGSSVGVSVYRNEGGSLSEVAFDIDTSEGHRQAYGVRWADVISDPDGCLELVVVGDSTDETSTSAGINYIYHFDGDMFVEQGTFVSDYQLVRVEPGDFDNDGDIDLIGSTNAINADCNVGLYFNDGAGDFEAVSPACLSWHATAALAAADFDADNDLDLAMGAFPGTIQILENALPHEGPIAPDINAFDTQDPILVESFLEYLPYDLAWGDYDQDADFDLAAAYPIQREVHIYENGDGNELVPFQSVATGPFMTPLALDWGDFNGDGHLELAVADSPPAFYFYDATDGTFKEWLLDLPANSGQIWSLRGIDLNNQSNLDLIMTNRDGPSQIFPAFSPNLESDLAPVTSASWGAGSVAWGDVDDDGDFDLLFGSSTAPNSSSFLYENQDGTFPSGQGIADSFGPHTVAFGNIQIDDQLDVAIGTPAALLVYRDGAFGSPIDVPSEQTILSLAWADPNDDSQSELLVGYAGDEDDRGLIALFYFDGGTATPTFTTTVNGDVRSLAWADIDGDYYLDFAAGIDGGPTQIYRNTGDGSFSLDWETPTSTATRAVAWADVDADGDLDLAVGSHSAQDVVWENTDGAFSASDVGPADSNTTSLAWGDWNNDGYPDLAVGIDGEQDVVYANIGSEPGALRLSPLWRSADHAATTGVAWGDADGDGDLDLAVSRSDGAQSGFYENTMWPAAHLAGDNTLNTSILPNTPVYVSVDRPSSSPAAYFYSAPELVTGPNHPTVTVTYRLFDPEAKPVAETFFEYSVDGGGVWLQATASASATLPSNSTGPYGVEHAFVWDARADVAISDNARFRVRVTHQDDLGNGQRATSIGVSPPFRVRSLDCYWPVGAAIIATNDHPELGEEIILTATLDFGSGQVNASWDLDDGTTDTGWVITHTYQHHGVFNVTLRVDGPACPIARPAFARQDIVAGLGYLPPRAYIPFVANNQTVSRASTTPVAASGSAPETRPTAPSPGTSPRQSTPLPLPFALAPLEGDEVPSSRADNSIEAVPSSSDFIQINRNRIGFQSQPAVNSDGEYIAFWSTGDFDTTSSNVNPDGNIEIFLAHVESTRDIAYTQVTSSTGSILGGFNLYPDIDAVGDTIVFFSDGDLIEGQNPDLNFEIFLAQVSPVAPPRLTQVTHTAQGVNILPSISADGRRIAFVSNQNLDGVNSDGNQEIFVAEIDNTNQVSDTVQITESDGCFNDHPSLSSDGRFVAFVSDCDGNREIYLAELGANGSATSIIQVTTSASGESHSPSIDGDGNRIAFISDLDDPAGPAQAYLAEVNIATPAVSSITRLTDDGTDKAQPSLSTDGHRLAFVLIESPTVRRLSLYDVDNQNSVRLSTGDNNLYPSLTEDGRGLAYVADWDILLANPPDIDLSIDKTADPAVVGAEDPLTYGLTLVNQGTEAVSGGIVSDTLPYGATAQLPAEPSDYVDDDGSATGFGGGTPDGASWDPDVEALTMDSPSGGVSTFDSRIMERSNGAHGWNSIGLLPTRPLGMPLPDDNAFESDYPAGNVDMADNVLLLHLDELVGSESFIDTSGEENHMSCRVPSELRSCPTAGADGVLGNAISLFNGDYQSIVLDNTDSATESDLVVANDFTIALWVNPDDLYHHQVFITKHIYIPGGDGDIIHFGLRNGLYRFKLRHVAYEEGSVTTGWQHLTVVGRTNAAETQTDVTLYRNGDELWTHTFNIAADDEADGKWAIGNDFDVDYSADNFLYGDIDEVAVFNRAMDADEIQDIYLRGALQARFQVRTCDDRFCDTETFAGPDGTNATYYPSYNSATRVYEQNFEQDNGGYSWQPEWEWGPPSTWPSSCASGRLCWGTDLNGYYENNSYQVLQSPVINLANVAPGSQVILEWWQAWHIESSWYDQAYAQISYNGAPWQTIWQHDGSTTQVGWTRLTRDVSAGAGGTIRLRWILSTDYSITYSGYYIDAVRITASPPPSTFEEDYFGRYPPAFLLNLRQDQQYFQYRAYLDTYDDTDVPEITSIAVNPQINCGGHEAVTCYLDPYLPLSSGGTVAWEIPTLVSADAYDEATLVGNTPVITNTAEVDGIGFELTPGDNTASASTLLETNQVGDFVWEDSDGDGLQDEGSANGFAGVTVRLYDPGPDGQIGYGDDENLFTTTTNADGIYTFFNLPSGKYYIAFEAPSGYVFTQRDAGNDDAYDSDADGDGNTIVFGLDSGTTDNDWDAGLYQPISLGDFVWEDADGDGIQDAGESGIQDVTVELRDNQGGLVITTTTASDGSYHFYNVTPGRYSICFIAPTNYVFTLQNAGTDDTIDSDAAPDTGCTTSFNVNSGATRNRWDAGLYQPASLGDFVWEDMNADGIQGINAPGLGGVTVRLYDSGNNQLASTTSASNGSYSFTGLPPGSYYLGFVAPTGYTFSPPNVGANDARDSDANPATGQTALTTLVSGEAEMIWDAGLYQTASVGGRVWGESDFDGIREPGEPNMNGVTVNLYDSGDNLVITTTTASDGSYSFTGLVPSNYTLEFVPPSGYLFTQQDAGSNDNLDSDAEPASGRTTTITLRSGDNDLSWGAGFRLASVGNRTWVDANSNGIQNDGEAGLGGVTVRLYNSGNVLVDTTTTAANGIYHFNDVFPGIYYLRFTEPVSYTFTIPNIGDDTTDSDANANGYTISFSLSSGDSSDTWDAGFIETTRSSRLMDVPHLAALPAWFRPMIPGNLRN